MTISLMEALLLMPVMSLKATQMYVKSMSLYKGGVIYSDILETKVSLTCQLKTLGGTESAEQLSVALFPLSTAHGPLMVGVSGPSENSQCRNQEFVSDQSILNIYTSQFCCDLSTKYNI